MIKTAITDWICEEKFFDMARHSPTLVKVDYKWSEGSSPILLVKAGFIKKEAWEKCFWYDYPSEARCWECEHMNNCDKYVGPK